VEAAYPRARVELWTMDEHRLGLKPVLRRVWALRGQRPVVRVRPRYEWLYVYCFVHPATGATCWLLLPQVNAAVFSLALAHFAREVGAGEHKRIVLVLDQAGYHIGKGVVLPAGIELEFLPAYSPELQPAERVWPLTNEGVANRLFADPDELEAALARRCLALAEQPELVRTHTLYHWWPQGA
jgi:hypothetical protein